MHDTAKVQRKKNELYFPQAEAFFQEKTSGEKEFPAPGLTQAGLHLAAFCPIPHVQPPTHAMVTIPARAQVIVEAFTGPRPLVPQSPILTSSFICLHCHHPGLAHWCLLSGHLQSLLLRTTLPHPYLPLTAATRSS